MPEAKPNRLILTTGAQSLEQFTLGTRARCRFARSLTGVSRSPRPAKGLTQARAVPSGTGTFGTA